jgi:multicomponent Na+:H+ antiporter subunit C
MIWETSLLIGVLFGVACYLILRSSFVRILFGFLLLTHAANLFVLALSGNPAGRAAPVILKAGAPMVDPLPQALVLTAIVIGFGVAAYLVVLLYRIFLDQRITNLRDLFDLNRRPPQEEESDR